MSEIITDKLTGKTSAGDVTITSEGGSATMQLQQGVAKAWAFTTADGQTINDSFNVSTLVDNGVGIHTIEYTNNMNNALYSGTMSAESSSDANTQWMENIATTGIQARHYDGSGYQDIPTMWQIMGDLA